MAGVSKQADSLSPGEVLDSKFEIRRELARGGMGVVYVARHLALGRDVAVKVLLGELTNHLDLAARFEQEARAASAIGHPNIIQVYDLGRSENGLLYMVMELLEGASLRQLLEAEGKLPVSRALRLVDQVLSALAAAHKRGIVHRDLKPENIFVVQTEYQPEFVKLLDFGISKILPASAPGHLGQDRQATRAGTVMGTPEYMAPEQAAGAVDQVDARTDIYAIGVVLYELLTGETPFAGGNYNAVMAAIIDGRHRRARELRASVPERLDEVIETAIASARERRFGSAAEMREALVASQDAAEWTPPVLELDDLDEPPRAALGLARPPPSEATPEPFVPASMAPLPAPGRDPFSAPDQGPEAELLLESEVRPAPLARVRATPLPVAVVRASARSSGGTSRTLIALLVVAALGAGGFVGFQQVRAPEVNVPVAVSPAGADVRVDGATLASARATLRAGAHELHVAAPGHVARRVRFAARPGAHVDVSLVSVLPPVSARDPELEGVDMPAPAVTETAPPAAELEAALTKLTRVRACLEPIDQLSDDAAVLETAAGCLQAAHPTLPTLDDAAAALTRLTALLRAGTQPKLAKAKGYKQDLAAAQEAALASVEALRHMVIAAEESTQQALLARLERGLGFAARRYVLAATAAWRRGEPRLAKAAFDELVAFCLPRHDCEALVHAATAHQQRPRLESLNALIGAYDAAMTD